MVRTAGSWLVLGGLGAAGLAWPFGCNPDETGTPPTGEAGLADVLAAVGPEVVIPTLTTFRADAVALRDAAQIWADASTSAAAPTERAAAADAWRAAMRTWQQAELMQIGPAGSSLTAVAGADLRDAIYSWPTTNPCRVDQETLEEAWDDADWFTVNLVNSYGLDALEHLLFAGDQPACPPQALPPETWAALGSDGVDRNRAAYAVALSDDLIRRTDTLLAAWQDGSFALDTSVYESEQAALNAVYDGLFYIEKQVKDRKVAEPVGLGACATDCLALVELRPSGMSTDALKANFAGFELLYTGGAGPGMDDLLRSAGHGDLADAFVTALADANAALDGLEGPLDEVLLADPSRGPELHAAIKGVTDLVKGDLATLLALEIPAEASGDND